MLIFKEAKELYNYIDQQKKEDKIIGFVPTMGALHQGHLSLITASKKTNDLTICSIFVNPTQFNNPEDFKHYPVTIEKDIEALISIGSDILFLPSVEEIYPADFQKKHYPLGEIENILEGKYRPGHFQGVCQVVDRLLQIVQPHNLYLGQKDFQQCMVIKKMIALISKENEIKLTIAPTMRDEDGLAMSSRNLRLNIEQRKIAPVIFKELSAIKNNFQHKDLQALKNEAKNNLEEKGFVVDYIEIANRNNLTSATNFSNQLVALVAATIGNIRLIDNVILN